MLRTLIISLLLFFSVHVYSQPVSYEQQSFNIFFDSIYKERYLSFKTVEFNGYSEERQTDFGLYENCFSNADSIHVMLRMNSFGKEFPKIPISVSQVKDLKFKKIRIRSRKRLKVFLYSANEINQKVYVMIDITKQYSYTDSYIFEFKKDGRLIRWCKTGVIY